MASVFRNDAGEYQLQFSGDDGRRKTLWLGKCSANFAEDFRLRVEAMQLSLHASRPFDTVTQAWLDALPVKFHKRLATKGLIATNAVATVAQLCDYAISMADISERGLQKYHDAKDSLVRFFGDHRGIFQITPGDADEFVAWLKKHGRRPKPGPLKAFTVSKRVEQVKSFFLVAVRKRWIAASPFDGISVPAYIEEDRKEYVERDTIAKVMAKADPEMQLLIAMARYLGLRTPSETWPLKWEWVDWEAGILTVQDSKRRKYADKRWRFPPIFPEVQELLWNHFNSPNTDPVYIFNRKWATETDTALRRRLERLCLRAKVLPWVKPWQNLRSTRETELVDQGYPIHVVCEWIGNSPKVAYKHYLQIAKEHTNRALGDTRSGLQRWADIARKTSAENPANPERSPAFIASGEPLEGR